MQRVFESERNKVDSERYIEKLKNIEDTRIKSPTSNQSVIYELKYERSRILLYQKNLRYRKQIKQKRNTISKFLGSTIIKGCKDKFKNRNSSFTYKK